MTFEQFESIVKAFFGIGMAVFLVYYIYLFISANYNSYQNNKAPVITTRATVMSKRQTSDNAIFNSFYNRTSGEVVHITFHTDAGTAVEVCTDYVKAYPILEGTTGELTYQRAKLWKFIPD